MQLASDLTKEHNFLSVFDRLCQFAHEQPRQTAIIHLADGENISKKYTYEELWQRVERIAGQLAHYAKPGDCAVLCIDNEAEFLLALMACFYCQVIAIPSLPPTNDRTVKRVESHLSDSGAAIVLLDDQAEKNLQSKQYQGLLTQVLRLNVSNGASQIFNAGLPVPIISGDDIAYLQYTSGSTREPRGVMISHSHLVEQERMLSQKFTMEAGEVLVNWMPLHHDFGLVMSLLALYTGGCCVLLPPVRVVQQPIRWLRAIGRFRASTSAGAVFMFEQCVRKIQPEQCLGLDLNCLRQVFIGAEPIHAPVVRGFLDKFMGYGFKPQALWPGFGMAEATLVVTLKDHGQPVFRAFDEASLQQKRVLASEKGKLLVSSGRPVFENSVCIVDPDTGMACPADVVGELWVKNPCVGQGYWRQAELTQTTFKARVAPVGTEHYLRTGDLAFIHEHEVFIAGRLKDTLIINGENRYPQDIEWVANQCHPDLEPGAVVAIGMEINGVEGLAIVCEVKRTARNRLDVEGIVSAVRGAVTKQLGLDVQSVVLLQPVSLPKTSSGKVQRQACKQKLLSRELPAIAAWNFNDLLVPYSPPPKSNELLALCRTILNDAHLGPDDDVFAHGADSIKSVELISEIERRWQCQIDLVQFNQKPTINCLLGLLTYKQGLVDKPGQSTTISDFNALPISVFRPLAEEKLHGLLAYTSAWHAEWVSPNRLVFGMNTQGTRPPLFWCFQGHQEFSQLALYLGLDQPLYGFRSGHLVFDYTDKAAVTGLAVHYLQELLDSLPRPDYLLGGNCQAGVLATRMAQLLVGFGGKVRQLFILENIVPKVDACMLPFKTALFFGRHSPDINPYLQFPSPDGVWQKLYPAGYSIDIINSEHGKFFEEPGIGDFANKLRHRLDAAGKTSATGFLPDSAFSALIKVDAVPTWRVGENVMVSVHVTNTGHEPWSATEGQSTLIVANHWLDEEGKTLQWLDGYVPMVGAVLPSARVTVTLPVTAPKIPGNYVLEIDLAEQGIVWFKEKGNPACQLIIDVKPGSE